MDPTLITLLIGCILWAVLLCYFFIYRRAKDLGAGGKSALIIITFILVPVIGFVLWGQKQSFQRLEELGFEAYQGLGHSFGVATGAGDSSTWLYSLSSSEDALLDFYRNPAKHKGWKLIAEESGGLTFERGNSKMLIRVSDGNVAFLLFDSQKEK